MRKLSRFALPQARILVPKTSLVNRAIPRRLSMENAARGRHDELRHSSKVETAVMVRFRAMIAHGPAPATASDIATTQLAVVAMIVLSSRLRNLNSRVSRDPWTIPGAVNRNTRDRTANRLWTRGSP